MEATYSVKSNLPKYFIRPDDGEVFSLNLDNKTYSMELMKKQFPASLNTMWTYDQLINVGFIPKEKL